MIGRFPFQRLAKYPHMKPEDIRVWERFVDQNPTRFDSCDYDVPCGTGAQHESDHPVEIVAGFTQLTQKKIDVVAWSVNFATVIEVGPIADMRKLGQALVYKHLYEQDHPELGPVGIAVIAGEMERELGPIYAAQGVTVLLAPIVVSNS